MLQWLREIREDKGISQNKLSKMVGLSRAGYTNIENNHRNPSVMTAKKIALVLDFDWSWFFDEEFQDETKRD